MGDTKSTAKPTQVLLDELVEAARGVLRDQDALGERATSTETLRAVLSHVIQPDRDNATSVPIDTAEPGITQCDLWVRGGDVLTVWLDQNRKMSFPAELPLIAHLNDTIRDLARAAKAVLYSAENESGDTLQLIQPIEGIADAIVMLAQLSDGMLENARWVPA